MAGTRKPVSPAWARRNELARLRGYRSYYDYRAHNYGRLPADAPRVTGEQLSRLRGHRGRGELLRAARDGDVISVTGSSERDKRGRFTWIEVTRIDAAGRARTYRLTGADMKETRILALLDELESAGAFLVIAGSWPGAKELRELRGGPHVVSRPAP